MTNKKLLKKFEQIVGKDYASDKPEDLLCYSYDATTKEHLPQFVLKPISALEISEILKIANQEKIPIVPRGAGTGFAGGAINIKGGIALVTNRMNKIISIDHENFTAVVEPGVANERFKKEVEKKGLFYPPDPASLKVSTLGGNVAMCAGGPSAVKYGVTKDYVIGMEVVLADGEIIKLGGSAIKNVVGYDLTKLMVGSEGTLGIITKIILRLIPKPKSTQTLAASFRRIEDATQTVVDIMSAKITPSCLEFMDKSAIWCVSEHILPGLIPKESEAALLIEVDGEEAYIKDQKETIASICQKNQSLDIQIAKTEKEREALWQARRSISPALRKLNKMKINEDIAVPRNKIPETIKRLHAISEKYQITIVNFGHAGDGNIHVNIMVDEKSPIEVKKSNDVIKEVFDTALDMGGTISGEHGVGLSKMPYIKKELDELTITLMKKIKGVFDPNNIINPGKVFF